MRSSCPRWTCSPLVKLPAEPDEAGGPPLRSSTSYGTTSRTPSPAPCGRPAPPGARRSSPSSLLSRIAQPPPRDLENRRIWQACSQHTPELRGDPTHQTDSRLTGTKAKVRRHGRRPNHRPFHPLGRVREADIETDRKSRSGC